MIHLFHKWSKWEKYEQSIRKAFVSMSMIRYDIQKRERRSCLICGKNQDRIYANTVEDVDEYGLRKD